MLAEEYSILHLIPSEVAGQVALAGSDEDKKFVEKKINADTKELPDDALCKLLRKVIHQSIQNDITWFILEGVPASIDQFRRFDKVCFLCSSVLQSVWIYVSPGSGYTSGRCPS